MLGLGAMGVLGCSAIALRSRVAFGAEGPPRLRIPVRFALATEMSKDLQAAQRAEADRHYPMLQFQWPTATDEVDAKFQTLDTRADRDALRKLLVPHQVNVFFVESLRDVDDRSLYRRGVHWRPAPQPSVRYIIVIRDAPPSVLAHELGHYFGLPHTTTRNNLMSYDRDGGEIFLDDAQRAIVTKTARGLLSRSELKEKLVLEEPPCRAFVRA